MRQNKASQTKGKRQTRQDKAGQDTRHKTRQGIHTRQICNSEEKRTSCRCLRRHEDVRLPKGQAAKKTVFKRQGRHGRTTKEHQALKIDGPMRYAISCWWGEDGIVGHDRTKPATHARVEAVISWDVVNGKKKEKKKEKKEKNNTNQMLQ